jgi:tetratricopeptide (TPR) repeat protein
MNLSRVLTVLAVAAGAGVAFLVLRPHASGPLQDGAEARSSEESSAQGQAVASLSPAHGGETGAGRTGMSEEDASESEPDEEPEEDVTATLVTTAIEAMLQQEPPRSRRATEDRSARKHSRASDGGDDADHTQSERDSVRSKQLWQEAREARKAGDYERALALLNESIEQDPLNKHAYRDLANLYRAMGMQAEELQAYQDWANAAPDDPLARYMMASAYERYGMDQEAYAQLAEFQRLNAGDVSTYPMAASMYSRLGMKDQQGAVLESWVSDVPDSLDARRALGQYYRSTGNYEAAVAQYSAATALVPGNAAAHVDLASAYTSLREYDAAQAELATAAELRPGDLGIQLRLGDVYRREGDLYSALDVYEGIVAANPNAPEAGRASRQITRINSQLAANKQT